MRLLVLLAAGVLLPSAASAASPGARADSMLAGDTPITAWLTVLPILLPMLGSAITLVLRDRTSWQGSIALAALALATICAALLNVVVAQDGPQVMAAGNWLPPFGIVVTVDRLGALFVLATCVVGLVGIGYARSDIDEGRTTFGFYTFYCLLIAGVCGTFSTGDIFNLYVWFEVFLVSSFGLLILGGERLQLDGAVKYGVLNLIATTIFLIAVGVLYGFTGTLNMADIRGVIAEAEGGPFATVGALFVMAFAMKAAAFPLHFWLPASYHTPRVVVAAIFAGLLTKVGIYSLLRVMIMLFGDKGEVYLPLIGWLGVATAILGGLGALAQTNLRRMAAFLVVSGIGVMLIGFGLGTADGLTGAVVYAVHSILAMTGIFLAVGAAERLGGGATLVGAGIYARSSVVAGLFLVFAFAAAGLPPFSGFWPKLMLVQASLDTAGALGIAGVVGVILSGFLTTVTAGKAWALTFLKPADGAVVEADGRVGSGAIMLLAALVVLLGLLPQMVIDPAREGVAGLLDPSTYVSRVLEAH
ncbi:proton-conducting transporter membrane subunit [Acuticoccus sp. I52.16.1]|uniref:proton-conducting transporter transmembrane domain-containing protein n=1 Tax=Acuticoccus sp. I52.16.1 TaxID=2928472 RepID=UPI001FD4542F|nr:proton-conducting transporter membrane subunit [Acuticoccus sp. I52.16.1]UOM34343.1 Na+/H+ antiporter subunit D [Acuticoccus sp. I52.16.1]